MNLSEKEILEFYLKAIKLKQITRRGWVQKGISNAESVADHTFGVCVLSLLYAMIYGLDVKKVLIMALFHDIAETKIGDITPLDDFPIEEKQKLEDTETQKILLEIDKTNDLYKLWIDFEHKLSDEGKLVKQIDKLEVALQALIYEKEQNIDFSDFFTSVSQFIDSEYLNRLLNEIELMRDQK